MANLLSVAPRQNYVVFGILATPGVASVKNLSRKYSWKAQQGFGVSGATSTFVGSPLAEWEVEVRMWTDDQLAQWTAFARLCLAPPGNGATVGGAFEIQHPLLSGPPWSIKHATVTEVGQLNLSDAGLWTVTIKCQEWRKPKTQESRPIAAIPAVASPPPVAQTEAEVTNEKLVAEAKGKGGF